MLTLQGGVTARDQFATAHSNGVIQISGGPIIPQWVNPGFATGPKYLADLNVIAHVSGRQMVDCLHWGTAASGAAD